MRKWNLGYLLVLPCALLASTVFGRVLDDFNDNTKTAWQDFAFQNGYASITEANGQFNFSLIPVGQSIFAASTKTSETFDLKEGRTIEFRADLVTGNGNDSFAILAFIPTSSQVSSLNGYGFSKSASDVLVSKSIGKYFYNENPPTPLKNDNVTMVLSLTVKNGSVIINAKLLDKDANNAVIFEQTFTDTPAADVLSDGTDNPPAPYLGSGNFVLLCYEDNGTTQASYDVTFDNAEVFVTDSTILDDFNDNTKTDWQDFAFQAGYASITEANGQFNFSLIPVGQSIFAASTKTSRTFDLVEGERIQFSVDLVSGNGNDSFAILAFIPTSSQVSSLNGYGFSKSASDILVSKSIGKYFYNEDPAVPIKNDNVTLVLTLTVRNGSVEINAKVLDKDANNAVIFEQSFVDTPGADILADGTDNPPAPYIGSGHFVLFCYEDDGRTQTSYDVTFDNAIVAAAPAAANTLPVISDISPIPYSNFLPTGTPLSFKVVDDKPLDNNQINIVLNGQTINSANGLTITGTGNSRTVSYSSLGGNTNYVALLNVTDADNGKSTATIYLDTFSTNNTVIESENYNFQSGGFVDSPTLYPEGTAGLPDSYMGQVGTVDIDYHDTRTDFRDVPYRPEDHVRMQHSLDAPRQKFTDAGGSAASIFDYDVGDVAAAEWLNYSHTFPTGDYEVYLRGALVNGAQAKVELQEVTSDSKATNQTTKTLGTFVIPATGYQYRNVPLTDALGQNKVVIHLSGLKTLRIFQVDAEPADGGIYQNYFVFVPVQGVPVQRATISSLSPSAGTTVETLNPTITATIQNRDTSVRTNSIKLFVNNSPVTPQITATSNDASLTYAITPLPASGSTITGRIEFTDNENVTQTNEWIFTITYKSLDPANRQAGSGANRGLNLHLVQATLDVQPLENSLARAEAQLAPNSTIPKAVETNVVVDIVNFNKNAVDEGEFPGDLPVPGIDIESGNLNDFAVEMTAYLDLSAGVHRFAIRTDDGYKLSSSSILNDRNASPLAFHNGGPANETVEFLVTEAGLYPFRLVWYERGGSGYAEWSSVDLQTGEKTLINDPNSATPVKAYTSLSAAATLIVESSTVVTGGFSQDSSAVIDTANKKITIPRPAGTRFYRLSGVQSTISGFQISGNSLILTYQ